MAFEPGTPYDDVGWHRMNLMPMKVREVIRLLEKRGWIEMRSKGSHRHFKHPDLACIPTWRV